MSVDIQISSQKRRASFVLRINIIHKFCLYRPGRRKQEGRSSFRITVFVGVSICTDLSRLAALSCAALTRPARDRFLWLSDDLPDCEPLATVSLRSEIRRAVDFSHRGALRRHEERDKRWEKKRRDWKPLNFDLLHRRMGRGNMIPGHPLDEKG